MGLAAAAEGAPAAGDAAGCCTPGAALAALLRRLVSAAAVLSAAVVAERRGEKKRGTITNTSAINTSAKRVRLSIRKVPDLKEPDRIRLDGKGGTARSGVARANHRAMRRAAPAPQWHRRSNLDNSGTTAAAEATASPDRREPRAPEPYASTLCFRFGFRGANETLRHGSNIHSQCGERRAIRFASSANHDVGCRRGRDSWKQRRAHELAQSALQRVAIDGRALMPRHHQPDPRTRERGSGRSDIEMHGPNALPLPNNSLQIVAPRQSSLTREPELALTPRRTCWAV